ncbi:MAG: glutamine--tRNA ligase/YqeY domain fusion protein [Clostridiales bacterium]|nr:glutamine--tRNA ligase/YqeY domain fusion protein [Clostridiales bacterium]
METEAKAKNFIEENIDADIASGKVTKVMTRFPPEPNGYLHIGHAKALAIDFGMAQQYGGKCNLRFDDTNPTKEDEEFVDAIIEDIHWLGFDYEKICYGSDYFDICYDLAEKLIKKGVAYVCDLSKDEIREYRGTLTEPGKNSPYRDRSVEENLDLFRRMRAGEFPDGSRILRAKIDMASPNINMRDPALYRIIHMSHHHAGDKWCIYPMYDFAHPIQDAVEGITHSLCSLEYEAHRPLYDWVIEQCEFEHKPRQIEFARLNLTNTVMSKRYLRRLVEEKLVDGWDDPRMPTLCGLRRRGYTAASIIDFLGRVGIAKSDSIVDTAVLEHCVREDLNANAKRMMAVLEPLKVVITNYPEDQTETLTLEDLPGSEHTHEMSFSREIYIERSDFMVEPAKKWFRLAPEKEVRLKNAYIIKCESFDTDEEGNVTTVYCTYDALSKTGDVNAGRKVKGTLHWVDSKTAVKAVVRNYDYLIEDDPTGEKDFTERLNPNSLIESEALIEADIKNAKPGDRFQFLRMGYYCCDSRHFTPEAPVINRIVGLKDSFTKTLKGDKK